MLSGSSPRYAYHIQLLGKCSWVVVVEMDAKQQYWTDFHFLNTAFSDVVDSSTMGGYPPWIEAPLVRLSYRNIGLRATGSVKSIAGLVLEYAVPFPLVYIFTPSALERYSDIFVFLLQLRRAKSSLENILIRGDSRKLDNGLKVFYALRSRLNWFVKWVFYSGSIKRGLMMRCLVLSLTSSLPTWVSQSTVVLVA